MDKMTHLYLLQASGSPPHTFRNSPHNLVLSGLSKGNKSSCEVVYIMKQRALYRTEAALSWKGILQDST